MLNSLTNTVPAREVQRNYRGVAQKVKKSQQPVVVLAKNTPQVAIISLEMLEEYNRLKQNEFAWMIVDRIQARNANRDYKQVLNDITSEVEAVRQEMYDQEKAGSH